MTDNTSSGSSDADDWASALAEQTAASAPAASEPAPAPTFAPATAQVFQQIQDAPAPAHSSSTPVDIARVLDVPVQLTAEIGRTRITIKNLLQGSVVELDGLAGQPLDVLINGYLIAQGEVVVVNEKYGIRLTDIVTPSERMQKLARA
jgi:flagellar motor switch protein FliN/FliY